MGEGRKRGKKAGGSENKRLENNNKLRGRDRRKVKKKWLQNEEWKKQNQIKPEARGRKRRSLRQKNPYGSSRKTQKEPGWGVLKGSQTFRTEDGAPDEKPKSENTKNGGGVARGVGPRKKQRSHQRRKRN